MERIHMNHLLDLIHRLRAGESERRIAQDLKLSRPTVHKYRELAAKHGYLEPDSPMPDAATLRAVLGPEPQPPHQLSSIEPHRDLVQRLIDQKVEMTAIYQQLRDDYQYTGSYSAVRRFVRRLSPYQPEAVVRVHTLPGEEMQVDFGHLGWLFDAVTRTLRPAYVFVATLCYSRHQYAEIVFDQKVSTWLALHQRAFESFGGVPRRVVPDNLKAAVKKALVLDPILGEAYRRMALHYGFLISPTIPGTPRHKGKVESGVHYVKRNFWSGRQFVDSIVANQRLKVWVHDVAGTREHGTTHQAPLHLFQEYERGALLPLPDEPFTLCEIKPVTVHPDCHVVIDKSFYSVPYTYIGHRLTAHISQRMVEIYNGDDLIASHLRSQHPGEWHTRMEDYPPGKVDYLIRTPDFCRKHADRLGPATRQVVDTLLADRPLDRLRSVQAILRLEDTVGPQRLEAACARAVYFGDVRYRRIKEILNAALDREPLPEAPAPEPPSRPFTFARSSEEFFPPGSEVIQ
jgi:transposase